MVRRALAGFVLVVAASSAQAAVSERGALSLLVENDYFIHKTDRDFTNGIALAYVTPPADNPDKIIAIAQALPFFPANGQVRASYELGQNIYTPEDLDAYDPAPTERPYAGFLYGAVGLVSQNSAASSLDQLVVQLGIIGPASLAGDTQKWFHGLFGFKHPNGWHTQLRDEPGLAIIDEHSFRFGTAKGDNAGFGIDLEPHVGGAVGNVYDYVNAGAMLRFGYSLPDDFGPLRIEPSLPGANFYEDRDDFSFYAFAGVDGRAVGRNIFLDGNTWQASRSVVKKNLVGDFDVGVTMRLFRFRAAFTHVFRSREYASQLSVDEFGAFTISWQATL